MKKKVLVGILAGICILGLATTAVISAGKNAGAEPDNVFEKLGKYLWENHMPSGKPQVLYSKGKGEKLAKGLKGGAYAYGKDVAIPQQEYERTVKFFAISGKTEDVAKRQADEYIKKRYAMYAEAMAAGYDATEEELDNHIKELKEFLENADNNEEYEAMMKEFESEEAYWKYEKEVYRVSLPIEKYMETLETDYEEVRKQAVENQKFVNCN